MARAVGYAETWSRRLGLGFGAALAIIEVAYNWGNPSWWPFIAVDYIAVALLVAGAVWSPRVLAAGWGFACAMFYMAFFLAVEGGVTPASLLAGLGAMFVLTVVGLTLSLLAARAARQDAEPGTAGDRDRM